MTYQALGTILSTKYQALDTKLPTKYQALITKLSTKLKKDIKRYKLCSLFIFDIELITM